MHTVAEFTEAQYHSALELTSPTVDPAIVPEPVVDEAVFVLEKYLEEFIVGNFDAIFQGQFKIFIDSDGHNGQQYTTDIGPIDILAFEPSSNAFVVIELKRNHSSDQVVGQILRYMGWIKQNLCKPGQLVKGLVICRSADPKLIFALSMSANVDVRYYSVSFKLSETC